MSRPTLHLVRKPGSMLVEPRPGDRVLYAGDSPRCWRPDSRSDSEELTSEQVVDLVLDWAHRVIVW